MVHFVSELRVRLLLWVLIAPTRPEKGIEYLPDAGVISSFLEQFIQPYIETIKVVNVLRTAAETKVEKAIRLKIDALKPKLQDEDNDRKKVETENNLTLEGNDETTIIEFMPHVNSRRRKDKFMLRQLNPETDSFQKNINKYKKLRKTIKKLLDKENTTSSTKKLITRTLDEMIAQLIESQCTWKSIDPKDVKSNNKNIHRSINKLSNLSHPEWMSLRKQYLNFIKSTDYEEDGFIKQFHEIFTNVINDTWFLANRYKVRCQLVNVGNNRFSKKLLRDQKLEEKHQCGNFYVCSDELKDFLASFYSYLNNTAVSTFRNYAAMYIRDVNPDTGPEQDIDIVVSVIEKLSNYAEKKVSKIFIKKVNTFTLDDDKKKGANFQHIRDFITSTVAKVKKVLNTNLDFELDAMKTKIFAIVKEDLNVNLKVDMDNSGKVFVDKICALFAMCNGKYSGRRQQEKPWTFKPKESNNLYVKVQLTLDDELKQLARDGLNKPWPGKDLTYRFLENNYRNITVTRTTRSTTTDTTTARKDTTTARTDTTTARTVTTTAKASTTIARVGTRIGITDMPFREILDDTFRRMSGYNK